MGGAFCVIVLKLVRVTGDSMVLQNAGMRIRIRSDPLIFGSPDPCKSMLDPHPCAWDITVSEKDLSCEGGGDKSV